MALNESLFYSHFLSSPLPVFPVSIPVCPRQQDDEGQWHQRACGVQVTPVVRSISQDTQGKSGGGWTHVLAPFSFLFFSFCNIHFCESETNLFCRHVRPSTTGGRWRWAERRNQWEPAMWPSRTSAPTQSTHPAGLVSHSVADVSAFWFPASCSRLLLSVWRQMNMGFRTKTNGLKRLCPNIYCSSLSISATCHEAEEHSRNVYITQWILGSVLAGICRYDITIQRHSIYCDILRYFRPMKYLHFFIQINCRKTVSTVLLHA